MIVVDGSLSLLPRLIGYLETSAMGLTALTMLPCQLQRDLRLVRQAPATRSVRIDLLNRPNQVIGSCPISAPMGGWLIGRVTKTPHRLPLPSGQGGNIGTERPKDQAAGSKQAQQTRPQTGTSCASGPYRTANRRAAGIGLSRWSRWQGRGKAKPEEGAWDSGMAEYVTS